MGRPAPGSHDARGQRGRCRSRACCGPVLSLEPHGPIERSPRAPRLEPQDARPDCAGGSRLWSPRALRVARQHPADALDRRGSASAALRRPGGALERFCRRDSHRPHERDAVCFRRRSVPRGLPIRAPDPGNDGVFDARAGRSGGVDLSRHGLSAGASAAAARRRHGRRARSGRPALADHPRAIRVERPGPCPDRRHRDAAPATGPAARQPRSGRRGGPGRRSRGARVPGSVDRRRRPRRLSALAAGPQRGDRAPRGARDALFPRFSGGRHADLSAQEEPSFGLLRPGIRPERDARLEADEGLDDSVRGPRRLLSGAVAPSGSRAQTGSAPLEAGMDRRRSGGGRLPSSLAVSQDRAFRSRPGPCRSRRGRVVSVGISGTSQRLSLSVLDDLDGSRGGCRCAVAREPCAASLAPGCGDRSAGASRWVGALGRARCPVSVG